MIHTFCEKPICCFCRFDEVGLNEQLGYTSPADLMELYPQFYFNNVSAYHQTAIRYLNVTTSNGYAVGGSQSFLTATSSGPNAS